MGEAGFLFSSLDSGSFGGGMTGFSLLEELFDELFLGLSLLLLLLEELLDDFGFSGSLIGGFSGEVGTTF